MVGDYGGNHWIARRVPDDVYVSNANQFGMDEFDLEDAYGEQKGFMCSDGFKRICREKSI